MKNLKLGILLLLFISCGKERKSLIQPTEVGNKVFNLLKSMNKISSKEYEKLVITYEDIKDLANDSDAPLGDYLRNDLKSITPESHDKISSTDYQNIKSQGIKYGIDWDKIKFVSFKHDIQTIEKGKILLGETYFNYDEKIYFVKSAAFFDGKGYVLIKIAEVEPKHKEGAF